MTVIKLAEKLAKPARFLLVDDEPDICTSLEAVLKRLGCECKAVHDGVIALELLKVESFVGILLDIKMAGITGFDVLKEMKEQKFDVPVIIITGFPSPDVYHLMDSYGVLAVVVKPFSLEELTDTLERFFSIFNVKHHRS